MSDASFLMLDRCFNDGSVVPAKAGTQGRRQGLGADVKIKHGGSERTELDCAVASLTNSSASDTPPCSPCLGGDPSQPPARLADCPDRGRESGLSPLPLPPNRTCGSPASGSPVGGVTCERTGGRGHGRFAS